MTPFAISEGRPHVADADRDRGRDHRRHAHALAAGRVEYGSGGARFALTGLSTAAGESHLHVISSGMPPLAGRFAWNWTPGYSWWLRDSTGNWHVGSSGEPDTYGDGMSLYSFGDGMQAFWLRLTPPLTVAPAEIVVTGPATQVRATVS